MFLSPGCPMFQLQNHSDKGVTDTADITFYTLNISVCLVACFDYDLCKVAVYEEANDICQIFTTRSIQDLTLTNNTFSDVYYRTCQGTLLISPEHSMLIFLSFVVAIRPSCVVHEAFKQQF